MQLKPFDLAAAGHDGTLSDEKNSLFVKPSLVAEINFYTQVQSLSQSNENLLIREKTDLGEEIEPLINWIPRYLGCMEEGLVAKDSKQKALLQYEAKKINFNNEATGITGDCKSESKPFAVLENLICGYNQPNILDIKLGSILYDSEASSEKIERLEKISESTTSGKLGVRICGMKLRQFENIDYSTLDASFFAVNKDEARACDYISVNKLLGRSQKTFEQLTKTLSIFFTNHLLGDQWTYVLLNNFLNRIKLLIETLEHTPIKLISSSVLFVMETDEIRLRRNSFEDTLIDNDYEVLSYMEDCIEDGENVIVDDETFDLETLSKQISLSKLKLIDFGHANIVNDYDKANFKPDENTLKGLYSLKKSIEAILAELYEE